MVSFFAIGVVSQRHEVQELESIVPVEELGITSNQISTDQDIENSTYERELLPSCNNFGVVPFIAQLVDVDSHSLPVSVQLFVRSRHSPAPFFHHTTFRVCTLGLDSITLPPHFLCLSRHCSLQLLYMLWELEVRK